MYCTYNIILYFTVSSSIPYVASVPTRPLFLILISPHPLFLMLLQPLPLFLFFASVQPHSLFLMLLQPYPVLLSVASSKVQTCPLFLLLLQPHVYTTLHCITLWCYNPILYSLQYVSTTSSSICNVGTASKMRLLQHIVYCTRL